MHNIVLFVIFVDELEFVSIEILNVGSRLRLRCATLLRTQLCSQLRASRTNAFFVQGDSLARHVGFKFMEHAT